MLVGLLPSRCPSMRVGTTLALMLAVATIGGDFAAAQSSGGDKKSDKPRKNDGLPNTPLVKVAKQQLDQLEEAFKQAQSAVATNESALRAAIAATKQAASDRDETRKAVRERYAEKFNLPAAIEQRDAAASTLKDAARPLLAKLKSRPEHEALTAELTDAEKRLDKLSETGDSPEARASIADELAAIRAKLRQLETAAIENDQKLKPLRDAEIEAEERLAAIKIKVANAAANDEEIKAAEKAWQEADAADNKARRELKASQAAVEATSVAVAQGQAQLAEAVRRSRPVGRRPRRR